VDPVPDPLLLRKCGSAGNRTRTSGSVASNSDHDTIEAVHSWTLLRKEKLNKSNRAFAVFVTWPSKVESHQKSLYATTKRSVTVFS
jgi:hypothetical protein